MAFNSPSYRRHYSRRCILVVAPSCRPPNRSSENILFRRFCNFPLGFQSSGVHEFRLPLCGLPLFSTHPWKNTEIPIWRSRHSPHSFESGISAFFLRIFFSVHVQHAPHLRVLFGNTQDEDVPLPPLASPLLLAAGCLLINTFCGMNGTVVSFLIALIWLLCFGWIQPETSTGQARRVGWGICTILLSVVISAVLILFHWRPSGASTTSLSAVFTRLSDIASAFLVLLNPTPMVIPVKFHTIYSIFNLLLIATAAGVLFRRVWNSSRNRRVATADFSLLISLGATIIMLLSIAVGRAEYWSPGLERHYGILGIIPAVVSWTTISLHLRRTMVSIWGLLFLCANIYLYTANFNWRTVHVDSMITNTVDLYGDISKGVVIDRFVENHVGKFFYIDTPRVRKVVEDRIRLLHRNKIVPYIFLSYGSRQASRRD